MPDSPTRMVVQCPECGAPLPPQAANTATTCPQCGVTSVPIAQPVAPIRILVQQIVGSAAPGAVATQLACPRCSAPLFEGKAEEVTLLGCGVCGGVWLDNAASQEVTKNAHPHVVDLAERARTHAKAHVAADLADLPCPVCQAMMKHARAVGVADVDVCESHGTWFDAGELTRVASVFGRIQDDLARQRWDRQMQAIVDRSAPPPHEVGYGDVALGALSILGALAGGSSRR